MEEQVTDAAVVYRLLPADPAGHIFVVTCRIRQPDPEGQQFFWPAWIPGSYLVRDYARHVLSLQASTGTERVALHKLDKATWRADPVDGPLLLTAEVYAHELSVRGAYLDPEQAFVNGVCLFPGIRGRESERCVLHLEAPAGSSSGNWSVATGMERLSGAAGHFGAFAARDYDELIDQPVLMGQLQRAEFTVAGVPHAISFTGCDEIDLERIADDLATLCACHGELFGPGLPMDRYEFLAMVVSKGYGGLEHRNSAALICSRSALPRPGEQSVPSGYREFLGLLSHEYFHLWNVKRIRPAELTPYDLRRENYTRQLWLFEGVTAYYDDLTLLRSGLIDAASYLELLGRSLTRVYRSGGRRRQTLEEASFDAWIKFYRPDENAQNALLSYYTKGAMVALSLDLELRLRTDGRVSLDSVMQALWREYGKGQGVPDGSFERIAEEVSGLHLEEFFQQALRSKVDPPLGILLAQFGVQLRLRATEGPDDKGGKPASAERTPVAWLGMGTRQEGERLIVAYVLHGGPAHAGGLAAGDQVLALNGERIDTAGLDTALRRLPLDRDATVHVFRRDDLMRLSMRPSRPPKDTACLSLEDTPDDATLARRRAWLGS